GAEAIFSFLPASWHAGKLPFTYGGIALLTVMNLRGVKESVTSIAPIFATFIVTHAILLLTAIGAHVPELPRVSMEVRQNIAVTTGALGIFGTIKLFMHAYSLGGG